MASSGLVPFPSLGSLAKALSPAAPLGESASGSPMNPRHQFVSPLQRPLCRSSLLPARTSEFDAVRCPLINMIGMALDR